MTHRGTRKRGRRRKASTDHVVCGDMRSRAMECLRCGATMPLNLPARVDVLLRCGKDFLALHRDCAPKEVASHG
jgi:hypothetical protein